MAMIQTNLPIHFSKTEILITCNSSCYGFTTMAERAFDLQDTFGTAVTSNDAIWRCSDKGPLRINKQSTFCYLQVGMLEPNCFFIPVPGLFFMPATPVCLLRCKVKNFWVTNAFHQALCWICCLYDEQPSYEMQ